MKSYTVLQKSQFLECDKDDYIIMCRLPKITIQTNQMDMALTLTMCLGEGS